ncbi:MAG: hypothetical protein K2X27_10640 [Candidatus Obscuribacterales bacterium]|nr:hypothetical protein [Candidatus Obscuribacterales bacterium]
MSAAYKMSLQAMVLAICIYFAASVCAAEKRIQDNHQKIELRLLAQGAANQSRSDATSSSKSDEIAPESSVESIAAESSGKPPRKKGWFGRLFDKAYFWRLRYYFVAQNAANCNLFYGLIQDDPLIGRASVDFRFDNGCHCHGYAQVTKIPKGRSVVGQEGFIKANCSDGRKIQGRFKTTSLTTGSASATDSLGNSYEATFGHTAAEAVLSVNLLRKKLGCPECSPKEIELKVQGKVLPCKN